MHKLILLKKGDNGKINCFLEFDSLSELEDYIWELDGKYILIINETWIYSFSKKEKTDTELSYYLAKTYGLILN